MPNLKDIKRRIGSVKNTQQITKAMKLVAAAKLRRAQESVMASRPYSEKVAEVMESVAMRSREDSHPLLRRKEPENILIIVMSGDKGLCGPFNTNVLKAASKIIADNPGKGVSLIITGRKGVDFFRRRKINIQKIILDYGKKLGYNLAGEIAAIATEEFSSGRVDRVYMVYNKFRNVVVQIPTTVSLLPVTIAKRDEHASPAVDYEYEPSEGEILNEVLTRYIESQIYQSLLESAASENGARMTAMDAATKAAKEMIEGLTLVYNRARQAAITKEIIEVVTGADAIK
ncbi:MAG: ATP synthase F1 subunit gamma [Nitrospinae bacterium]|nr:ATP synthase F1 subunit gamma [Nitrospinota bacterium]MBF0634046.1 ATP synthase F1 subunit gamma [Nitrospinota bacterium]